ncbi:MAG TPA: hypothetical protein VK836_24015 [Streptosporangiaceae bacterium]|nr:hypothetical protein [Streptosporangiaceae bacterium]
MVTPTIAGGVAAAALADEPPDAAALPVTVTVGAGFGLLFPHADSAMTVATAIKSAVAADRYVAGI